MQKNRKIMTLPSDFIKTMRDLLGNETDDFIAAMEAPPICSVRLNSRKPGASFPEGEPVAWCDTGYYLPQRPLFTLDPLLHAGAYYVQDASSMIYREVTLRILKLFAPDGIFPPVCVADICAAPGGKTTAIIDALPDGSRVTANEFVGKRAAILKENLSKWGYPEVTVMNRDTACFANSGASFDIVAVDAPCSGEGMMRKDETAVAQWSQKLIDSCASLQREILSNAAKAVKEGGFLIYSTCTFNRRENEENAEFICHHLGFEPIDLSFPEDWGIPRGIGTDLPVYRFMPHKTRGEGLFLAVFRRPGTWIPSLSRLTESKAGKASPAKCKKQPAAVDRKTGGKGSDSRDCIPDIEEILSVNFDRSRYPEAPLTKEQALSYLRREALSLPADTPKGIVIVTYNGLPLGPAKNIGSRANNLYPKNWRIRMN